MSLRLLEVVLPKEHAKRVHAIVREADAGEDVVYAYDADLTDDLAIVRVVMHQGGTETVMDRLEARFEDVDGFHMILILVEAAVPRPVDEPVPEPDAGEPPGQKGWLRRIGREELYQDVRGMSGRNPVFLVLVALATVVAAIGLLRDNVAVVIGSMVIAPLLGPIMGLSLATTLGDRELCGKSLKSGLSGLFLSLFVAALIGIVVPVDASIPEIASRTQVTYSDVALGFAVGVVGALSVTTRVATTLVGVMVAVALLPPLVVVGLLLGAGLIDPALQAGLLLSTFVISINLAGVLTFLVQGVLPPGHWEAGKARRRAIGVTVVWVGLLLLLAVLIAIAP